MFNIHHILYYLGDRYESGVQLYVFRQRSTSSWAPTGSIRLICTATRNQNSSTNTIAHSPSLLSVLRTNDSFPIAVLQLAPPDEHEEYLLCYHGMILRLTPIQRNIIMNYVAVKFRFDHFDSSRWQKKNNKKKKKISAH